MLAVDVGYGQLHRRLRNDPRVTVLERTNARGLARLPFRPSLLVCDVSFVASSSLLPPVLRLLEPGYDALVLVKPQFEAGQAEVGKEASSAIRRSAARRPRGGRRRAGLECDHGRRRRLRAARRRTSQFFVHLIDSDDPVLLDDIDDRIRDAVRG